MATATNPQTARQDQPTRSGRYRRWAWVGGIVATVLLVYALGLGWAAQKLQTDVQDSIHPLSVTQPDAH